MKRTIIVVAIALTLVVAGCGGPGDAPDDNETGTPGEDPGAGDDVGDNSSDPAGEEEEDSPRILTVSSIPASG